MEGLLSFLADLPPLLIYLVAAAMVAAETGLLVGLVLPGEATLLAAGFLAYEGTLQLLPALILLVAAGLLGDALAFSHGGRLGPRVRESRWVRRGGQRRWQRAEAMLVRRGGRAVLIARWIAFARTLMPRLVGMSGMRYRRFLPWDVVGVTTWVTASILIGYLAGGSYAQVSEVFGQAIGAIVLLMLSVLALVLVGRWLGRHPDPVRAAVGRVGGLAPVRELSRRYGATFRWLAEHLGPGWALALNLIAGVVMMFGFGFGLAWLIQRMVRHSGVPLVDAPIAGWFEARRNDMATDLALATISTLRGSFLVLVVGVVALVTTWRSRAWRIDLVGMLGTVGACVPLVVLALVADWSQPDTRPPADETFFPAQNAVVTASLCMLAWIVARSGHWGRAVAAWTAAAVGIVVVTGSRLYLGWNWPSETLASVLLGLLWSMVFIVAWTTRDAMVGAAPPTQEEPAELTCAGSGQRAGADHP